MEPRHTRTLLSTALALAVIGGGCGETKESKSTGAGASTTAAAGKQLAVTGTDYAFVGVPKTVASGTVVSFKNTSTKEVHELLALRLKDGESRDFSAIMQLPEAERDAAAEFRGVTVAFPGEAGFTPEGPVTLTEPGRYVFICTIPTGADPVAYREKAKTATGPVEVPGGPPHVAKGMVAELTVT